MAINHLIVYVCESSFDRGNLTGPNPTDRGGKLGTKRHVLTDQYGIPYLLESKCIIIYDLLIKNNYLFYPMARKALLTK